MGRGGGVTPKVVRVSVVRTVRRKKRRRGWRWRSRRRERRKRNRRRWRRRRRRKGSNFRGGNMGLFIKRLIIFCRLFYQDGFQL